MTAWLTHATSQALFMSQQCPSAWQTAEAHASQAGSSGPPVTQAECAQPPIPELLDAALVVAGPAVALVVVGPAPVLAGPVPVTAVDVVVVDEVVEGPALEICDASTVDAVDVEAPPAPPLPKASAPNRSSPVDVPQLAVAPTTPMPIAPASAKTRLGCSVRRYDTAVRFLTAEGYRESDERVALKRCIDSRRVRDGSHANADEGAHRDFEGEKRQNDERNFAGDVFGAGDAAKRSLRERLLDSARSQIDFALSYFGRPHRTIGIEVQFVEARLRGGGPA